jgi:hypothetical protein
VAGAPPAGYDTTTHSKKRVRSKTVVISVMRKLLLMRELNLKDWKPRP